MSNIQYYSPYIADEAWIALGEILYVLGERYAAWFEQNISRCRNTAMVMAAVREFWISHDDDCPCCMDSRCTCKPHDTGEFSD